MEMIIKKKKFKKDRKHIEFKEMMKKKYLQENAE